MTTMVRGKIVVLDGVLVGGSATGEHVARNLSPYAAPAGRSRPNL
jgi:hypothetical protein